MVRLLSSLLGVSASSSAIMIWWLGPRALLVDPFDISCLILPPDPLTPSNVIRLGLKATVVSWGLWSLSAILFRRYPDSRTLLVYCGVLEPYLLFLVLLPPSWILVNALFVGGLFLPCQGMATALLVAWCARRFG